jgi:DNA-binding MarR family transcriptional regulator
MDEQLLQQQMQTFIRLFGLLEQNHTPCQYPLSPSQAHALQLLRQHDQLALHQLADHLRLDKSTVSRLVTGLVDRGWVERSVNPHNRRETLLRLTDSGHATAEAVHRSAATRYQTIWRRLTLAQRAQLLESLATLNAVLRESTTDISDTPS